MLDSITDLLETRQRSGLITTLHKIRAHINIRGNELAEAAAELAVTHYDTLPPSQRRRIETGELVHAAIRKTAKRGGALHSAPDLRLVMADKCVRSMTTRDSIEYLSPTSEDTNTSPTEENRPNDWFVPLPTT